MVASSTSIARSTKEVSLPCIFPLSTRPERTEAGALQTDLPLGNGELILVVDDEESIREITRGTLETFGYTSSNRRAMVLRQLRYMLTAGTRSLLF